MATLISGSIDLTKINKALIKDNRWLNLTIWVNDEADKFGNDTKIQQNVEKGQERIYLGNGKVKKPVDNTPTDNDLPW